MPDTRSLGVTATPEYRRARELFARATPNPETASIEELRRGDDALWDQFVPADLHVDDVEAAGVPGLLVRSPGASAARTVLWFHGGGYMVGSARGRRAFAAELSRSGDCQVLLADYRLAPEHLYPAAFDDATTVYAWLADHVPPSSIVVGGDSAGGGLAAATLLAARDRGLPAAAGAILLSSWLDMTENGLDRESYLVNMKHEPVVTRDTYRRARATYLGGHDPRDPSASPLLGDLRNLPPMLVLVGGIESIADDSVEFARRASEAGCDVDLTVYPDMFHYWPFFASFLPAGRAAVDQMADFVRRSAHAA